MPINSHNPTRSSSPDAALHQHYGAESTPSRAPLSSIFHPTCNRFACYYPCTSSSDGSCSNARTWNSRGSRTCRRRGRRRGKSRPPRRSTPWCSRSRSRGVCHRMRSGKRGWGLCGGLVVRICERSCVLHIRDPNPSTRARIGRIMDRAKHNNEDRHGAPLVPCAGICHNRSRFLVLANHTIQSIHSSLTLLRST